MFPSEMDNGQSMLDVNIDTNLLSDFFDEENNGVTNISDVDCGSAFDWADDFISSASTPLPNDVTNENSPAAASSLPSTSPAPSVPDTPTPTPTSHPQVAQVVVTAQTAQTNIIQTAAQVPVSLSSQTILQKSAGIIQGIGGQHFVVKTANGQQIQFQQPHPAQGTSPAPNQQFSVPSPAISRSLTPSQSPAPSASPHINRSITPNQPMVQQSVITNSSVLTSAAASSPNIFHIAGGTTQAAQSQVLTNTVPIQSIIQNPSQNASIIPGQTVLPGHGNNIVHTQNAVIQNPNVVNLNVAHVLCGGSQQVGQQATGQIQNNIQGLPVSVQNHAGIQGAIQSNIQGNPVNLQGTIIQTPQGKSILIPNQQLGGQINLNTLQQQVIQGQQMIQSSGGTVIQNAMNVGNVIRLAAQPGQDKTNTVVPPNISLVNIGGPQGQQILIQRAPHPAQGQPQNIIFKALPQNLIQIQGSQAGQTNLQGTPLQAASQISQQILNQASSQSVQYQQVLAGTQQQSVKLVSQQGSQLNTQAGAVTLNLGGQNVNLVTGQNLNLQQISGLGTNAVGSMPGIIQQNGNQYIVQTAQTQLGSQQQQTVTVPTVNQTNLASQPKASAGSISSNIVSKALISSGLSQVINTQIKAEPKSSNSGTDSTPTTTTPASKSKSKKSKGNDGQVKGTPQQLAQNLQKIQIPISQFIATASNAAGINTAQSTPTTVTTTVSQAMVQIPAQLTVASTLSGSQVVSSVQSKSAIGIIQTASTASPIKIKPNIAKPGPPNVTLCQGSHDQQRIQKTQLEINKLLSQPNLTQDKLQKLNQLQQVLKEFSANIVQTVQTSSAGSVLSKPLKPLVQTSTVTTQAMVGQPPIAQPQVAVPTQTAQIKSEPGVHTLSVQQTAASQPSIVVQSQPSGTGLIQLAVSQTSTSTTSPQVITSVAHAVQQQFVPKVIKQSPNRNIKMAPAGSTQVIQIQTTPIATSTPTRPALQAGTVIRTPPPGKVAISATPSLPTQIKIANQVLTLNLTQQQKEKLQEHLGRMSMEQQEMFLKQQQHVLLRLQQQQQIQQQHIQVVRQTTTSPQAKPQLLIANPPGAIPITVQQIDKGINQIKVGVDALQTTPNRAVKRPASTDIPKGTLIHQQLSKDQQHAASPDTKSPFKDYKEACRRLLRYHVFQHHGPKEDSFRKAEDTFDGVADDLLKRSHTMVNKYRTLLLDESMRDKPSAEMVMIQRMLNQDLSSVIKREKEIIKKTPENFVPMPMKYLKKEEDMDDSAAETSALDTSAVKSETITESEYSDHEMSDSLHHSSASMDSEKVKISPPVPPGKVKLVIRNDGRGFTSTLKAKTPVKTEPPSPIYRQTTPEEPRLKVRVIEDKSFAEFTSNPYAEERDDLNISGERGDESGNVLSEELSCASVGSDYASTDMHPDLADTSFQAQLGRTGVEDCELPAFHETDEGVRATQKAKSLPLPSVPPGVGAMSVNQHQYSDISITDVSGDFPGVISPPHKPPDPGDAILSDFTPQIPHDFDPSTFGFSEFSSSGLQNQFVTPATTVSEPQTTYSSITAANGFHQHARGNTNHPLHITSSPTTAADVFRQNDHISSFPSSTRTSQSGGEGSPEVGNSVQSIMDFEDDSSEGGNIADISQGKDLAAGALSSKDLPPNEIMFSSPEFETADSNMEGEGLDASFESDANDPQNQMVDAQMQSAIHSILSLNQGDEQSDSFLDQSTNMSYYDNQASEVTDSSQDESEYYGDNTGDGGNLPSGSGEGEGDGEGEGEGETSMEDDLDAAVQSILM